MIYYHIHIFYGISKLWIKKFSNIEIEKPEWYTGNVYSAMAFGQITTHVTEKIQVAMSDVASSVASSATSSGGGVSGGGFRWTEE